MRRIFIIDDCEDDCEALARTLKAQGVDQIRCFHELPDLAALEMDEHGLVILDLILGNHTDGLKVLEQMSALGLTKTPIFLVSGVMSNLLQVAESYGRARGLTIVGSVEKPVCPSEIARILPLR
ncbi:MULTISPECIES: response regulator [Thalassobaculum]|uniref:Response regulator receiver domain-containing protein n=1 Tax=Thalassobaculum litoreum DSM 18839 TaxID=1123362 RepID=A0A8G2BE67_9PROT|nr:MULTISPECIES: response regulator [Thalassobaculum]SDF13040.1 Response regulator receiver domain-containing protein [Thalassobaculum litoreum DSM 18839]